MRILIIEDTEHLRSLFARILKARGFEVRVACDGLEALDCLAEFRPELVLTDLMMPRLGGLGFLRRLRAMPKWDVVPVVAMTAVATAAAECEARRAGAADFLAKPIDADTLLDCVGGYCGGG